MKPIGKNLIIIEIEEEIKTDSGLLLSAEDTDGLRDKKGEVVKEGTDVDVVKPKDLVYYDKRAGYKMVIEGKQYIIIQESDVVVVL